MILFLFGLYYAILVSTLGMAIWLARAVIHIPRPPFRLLFIILLFGIPLPTLYLMEINPLGGDWVTAAIILAETAVFAMTAVLICIRRLSSWSNVRSIALSVALVVIGVVWLELRFCVIVNDPDGNSVEIKPADLRWVHQGSGFSSPFHQSHGTRLKKGLVYFGFCRWTIYREKWIFEGHFSGFHNYRIRSSANTTDWGDWPLRIEISPNR